ncbi:MAG: response regulator [Oligoflexia bacterium]|nr:response regulator [Oligoflexia bacterium]
MVIRNAPLILIIDDSQDNVILLDKFLREAGMLTVSAEDGIQCFELAKRYKPDLILLDIVMPQIGGFEVCKKMKADPELADIPIVFLSALDDVEDKIKALTIGGVDYINRPFNGLEVLARIRIHLQIKEAFKLLVNQQSKKLEQLRNAVKEILIDPQTIPQAKFKVFHKPLEEVGGDFYDVFYIPEDLYGYFVADFSGHNIQSSFFTAALKSLLLQNSGPLFTPIETMNLINKVLRSIMTPGQHLTATYILLNRKSLSLSLINAGHPETIYIPVEADTNKVIIDKINKMGGGGDILGAYDTTILMQTSMKVKLGDKFILFTDGLLGNKNCLNIDCLINEIKIITEKNRTPTVDYLLNSLADRIGLISNEGQLSKQQVQKDDQLLLVFEV